MIKTLTALALCATALSSAAPAVAQAYGAPRDNGVVQPGHGFREQLEQLETRVRNGVQSGEIDRGEADRANRELSAIREEMMRLRSQGGELSDMDRGRLQERLDGLSRSIHWMREHGPVAGQPMPMPAPAQPPRYDNRPPMGSDVGGWTLERREAWMQERIDRARADGTLSRREAYRVQTSLNQVKVLQTRMLRRGGGRLRDADRAVLEQRLDRVRDAMRWLRQNNETAPWARP